LPSVAACDRVEVYQDLDRSGGGLGKREGFLSLLARLEGADPQGDVAVVASYDQSRAFRNTSDALDFFALLERKGWIEVAFVHGSFDRSPAGEFSYTAMAAAHAMERRMVGEKIRDSKRYAAARGEMIGAMPAGLIWSGTGVTRKVVVDEPVAEIVRRVFAEYATGRHSTREVARRLNAEGLIPPSFRGGWRADTVAQLMANVTYLGKTYSVSRTRKEGDLIQGQWPAIIDQATWDACHKRLGHRPGSGGRKYRQYAFRGLLRCTCGTKLTGQCLKGRMRYYCRHISGTCDARGIPEEKLLVWAGELFRRLDALQPADFEAAVQEAQVATPRAAPDAVASIERTLERIERLFLWGHWTEDRYVSERARLMELHQQLTEQATGGATRLLDVPQGVLTAWSSADSIARRELLACLFDDLHVRGGAIVGYAPRAERAAEVVLAATRRPGSTGS